MRHPSPWWLLLGALVLGACATNKPITGEMEMEHDPFAKEDLIAIDEMVVPSADGPIAVRVVARPKDPRFIEFIWSTSSTAWRYLTCHDVGLVADNVPVPMGESVYGRRVREADVFEQIRFMVRKEAVEDLGHSLVVEGRICKTRFRFNDKQKRLLLKLTQRLHKAAPTTSVPAAAPPPPPASAPQAETPSPDAK
jgi:hypothetical protein